MRAELRDWREVHLRETSYIAGRIYGDVQKIKRDGLSHVTGFVLNRVDRGDYWLIKTVGAYAYILWKDKEYKP